MRRLAMVAVLLLCAGWAPGTATRWAVCDRWRPVPVPDPTAIGELEDVAIVSPQEAWAVGYLGAETIRRPLVLHWEGVRWAAVPFPAVPGPASAVSLTAVSVVAPDRVWAVGWAGSEGHPTRPISATWNGERWRLVPLRDLVRRGALLGLDAIPGTQQLWAVGHDRDGALILRWNGTRWRRSPAPPGRGYGELADVAAFPGGAWAVGRRMIDHGEFVLTARWNGARWVGEPAPRGSATAVDGLRADRVWAVGARPSGRPGWSRPAVLTWNGHEWRRALPLSGIGSLPDVVVPAPGIVWAVGQAGGRPLIVARDRSGWTTSRVRSLDGWFGAIDGTPHNLWVTHAQLLQGGEPTTFDTYHRC